MPKYVRIAAALRTQIITRLAPGDRVPSEPAIIDEWNVSKTTAARALDLLEREGLITRVSGSGSFVAAVPDAVVIEVHPGARISARAAEPGEIPGAPPGTVVLVIQRPGAPDEVYRADVTVVVVSCPHATRAVSRAG